MNLKSKPFLLKPIGKDYLWGGSRINDDFSKGIDMVPLAESWECSTHPAGVCSVDSGEFSGQLLSEVLESNPEMLGTNNNGLSELPILIKLIDAKQDLSVQVHPDDTYAKVHENGQNGKTEVWYVLDTIGDTELIYGFNQDVSERVVRDGLKSGNIEKYLQRVKVQRDDVIFIDPGRVHGIGAGVLIAEIQQNSDLTYRMYDYNRVDKHGNKRELHIDKSMDVLDFKSSKELKQPLRVLKYRKGSASELLCRCEYFQVERLLINTERIREMAGFRTDSTTFQVLLCIRGCGVMSFGDEVIHIFKGDCVFVPAESCEYRLHGEIQFLRVGC